MAHRYAQPIIPLPDTLPETTLDTPDAEHPPRAFTWRGQRYSVRAILGRWRLEARWWEATPGVIATSATPGAVAAPTASNRQYYRLACVPDLLCEVYLDLLTGQWMLDTVYD